MNVIMGKAMQLQLGPGRMILLLRGQMSPPLFHKYGPANQVELDATLFSTFFQLIPLRILTHKLQHKEVNGTVLTSNSKTITRSEKANQTTLMCSACNVGLCTTSFEIYHGN